MFFKNIFYDIISLIFKHFECIQMVMDEVKAEIHIVYMIGAIILMMQMLDFIRDYQNTLEQP